MHFVVYHNCFVSAAVRRWLSRQRLGEAGKERESKWSESEWNECPLHSQVLLWSAGSVAAILIRLDFPTNI